MSTLQPSFFDDNPSPSHDGALVPRANTARPRSRKEQAFDRMLRRVQALRRRLDHEKQRLDDALIFHAAHVRPRIERAIDLRKQLIRTLAPFLDDRRLKANDRGVLKGIVAEQLEDVLMHEEQVDQDLRDLFERVHGVRFDDVAQEELDEARMDMSALFAELGLDVDPPEMRVDMTQEERAASAAELVDRLRQSMDEAASDQAPRAESRRARREQARLERLEQMRKSGLAAVYRRLVKELHPDLETDESLRAHKQAQMVEVTTAYARRDLATLLRLESQWLDGEQAADTARLSGDTLTAYTELLKEQIADLELQVAQLPFQPRYQPLVRWDAFIGASVLIDGPAEVRRLDAVIEILGRGLTKLSGDGALGHVRAAIAEKRAVERAMWRTGEPRRRRRRN